MRAYTIVVDGSPDETLSGDIPPFSGVVIEGGSLEGCVEQGREAITLYMEDLALARHEGGDSPGAAGSEGGAVGSAGLADEEAVDALRRAAAALGAGGAGVPAARGPRHAPPSHRAPPPPPFAPRQ